MLEIHRRTGYLLLATLVAQVILISAQVRTSSGTRVLQAVTFGVFSQVQLGTAWVFGGVRSVWDGYVGLRGAHEENLQLRQSLAQAQVKLLEQHAQALRAAQLERILDLRERTPLRTVAATVIAGDATGIFRTLTVDKGSSSGLRKDMAVISPAGVVGRIVEPPPLYAAKVQLLIDKEAGAGAIIERSGVGRRRRRAGPRRRGAARSAARLQPVGRQGGRPPGDVGSGRHLPARHHDRDAREGREGRRPLQAHRGDAGGGLRRGGRGAGRARSAADDRSVADRRRARDRRNGPPPRDASGAPGSPGDASSRGRRHHGAGEPAGRTARGAASRAAASGPGAADPRADRVDAADGDAVANAGACAAADTRNRARTVAPAAGEAPMKGATVGLAIIAALALQTSPFFGRNGAGIDLVLVVVVWAALQFGPAAGLLTGAAAGLAQDVLSAGIIGVGGFSKTLVGFGAGAVGSQFIVTNAPTRFVVLLVGAVVNELVFLGLYAAIEQRGFDMPWRQAGARALATAVVGIVLMIASNAIPAFLTRRRLRRGY